MSASIRLDNAASLHPTLRISLPTDFLGQVSADQCSPAVLIRLPPSLFIDPNTFPDSRPSSSSVQVHSFRHLNSTQPLLNTYDFNKVELELGVGYSNPSREKRKGRELMDSRAQTSRSGASQVKQIGEHQYMVASTGDNGGQSRYQEEYLDSQNVLAKETRAVLFTLRKDEAGSQSSNNNQPAKELVYDDLTGERIGGEREAILETNTLNIPIHSRYVSPQNVELNRHGSWRSAFAGNYEKVQLSKPDLLWMCKEVEYVLDSSQFDKVTATDLLPPPHSHLSFQLTPHESKWHFYRYKMPSQDTAFQINLPAGNASIAPIVLLVTFTSLALTALWIAAQAQSALSKVHRMQAQLGKRYSSKSQ